MIGKNEDILDSGESSTLLITKDDLVEWWENRRFLYNLIVGIAGIIFLLIVVFYQRKIFGTNIFEIFGYVALVSCIVYNILYTVSWLFDLLLFSITKKTLDEPVKITLFWIGVGISILPFILLLLLVIEIS